MFTSQDQDLEWPLLARQPGRLDRWAIALVATASLIGLAIVLAF